MVFSNNQNIPYDIDIEGGIDTQGNIKEVFGAEAIQNAIKAWLVSYENEALRGAYQGGYVTQWLVKPMTSFASDSIAHSIRDGFEQDFSPTAQLRGLQVTPDYDKRRWRIYIMVYIPVYKIITELDVYIKHQYVQ